MDPYETLVRELLARLAARDAEGAARCYHAEIFYSDPRFPQVGGCAVGVLWRMRFDQEPQFALTVDEVGVDGQGGAFARWHWRYVHHGRPVAVRVRSMFAFRDERIVRHYDHFSFWDWAAQAHGALGTALGWSAPFKWKLRRDAMRRLERFTDATV